MITDNTICAISTPPGIGGVAVVRVSGSDAIKIVGRLFKGRHELETVAANTIHFGTIERDGQILDEVLVSVFRAPHSFTGEDVVEISTHGSLYVQRTLVSWLVEAGAATAGPGEFTKRAFLNGKMSLNEAEAVADLIASDNESAHRLAMSEMRGSVSTELKKLRDKLLNITSLLELELDFADHEELEFADRKELRQLAEDIRAHLSALISSFSSGNAIKHGTPVAIVGPTNAGKSTLLNRLVGEERAIVSSVHGTTRDTIEDTAYIRGHLFRFIDTAGIRQTDNEVENIGIERSRKAADKATMVIVLHDLTAPNEPLYDWVESSKRIDVYNKVDLVAQERTNNHLCVSAKTGDLTELIDALVERVETSNNTGVVISNARHYAALVRAKEAIDRVIAGMQDGLSEELLALDLNDCLDSLAQITGEITNTEVLSNIFSRFCIGK